MVSLTYDMNGNDESIMRSIDKLQGLNDVLLIGGDLSYNVYNEVNGNFNNFLNIQGNGTPLQRNYFISAANQFQPDNSNSIAISNDFCKVNQDGLIDPNNCGLLYTASGGLERMEIDDDLLETFKVMKQEGFTDVEITINTPNGVETKTVSFDNYKSLDSTVFTDNCKRYNQMAEGHCEKCDLMLNYDRSDLSPEMAGINNMMDDIAQLEQQKANLESQIETFDAKYKQPLNNYQQSNGRKIKRIEYEELDVSDDIITTTYIAGISFLAAYIIYKVMDS